MLRKAPAVKLHCIIALTNSSVAAATSASSGCSADSLSDNSNRSINFAAFSGLSAAAGSRMCLPGARRRRGRQSSFPRGKRGRRALSGNSVLYRKAFLQFFSGLAVKSGHQPSRRDLVFECWKIAVLPCHHEDAFGLDRPFLLHQAACKGDMAPNITRLGLDRFFASSTALSPASFAAYQYAGGRQKTKILWILSSAFAISASASVSLSCVEQRKSKAGLGRGIGRVRCDDVTVKSRGSSGLPRARFISARLRFAVTDAGSSSRLGVGYCRAFKIEVQTVCEPKSLVGRGRICVDRESSFGQPFPRPSRFRCPGKSRPDRVAASGPRPTFSRWQELFRSRRHAARGRKDLPEIWKRSL